MVYYIYHMGTLIQLMFVVYGKHMSEMINFNNNLILIFMLIALGNKTEFLRYIGDLLYYF